MALNTRRPTAHPQAGIHAESFDSLVFIVPARTSPPTRPQLRRSAHLPSTIAHAPRSQRRVSARRSNLGPARAASAIARDAPPPHAQWCWPTLSRRTLPRTPTAPRGRQSRALHKQIRDPTPRVRLSLVAIAERKEHDWQERESRRKCLSGPLRDLALPPRPLTSPRNILRIRLTSDERCQPIIRSSLYQRFQSLPNRLGVGCGAARFLRVR